MSDRPHIPSVRVLPETIANKIAAGEVVERPASVVKELVENALDAGASRIAVHLVGAGRRTIEVVDNGHGMSEQDAILAVERHTTSKIRKEDDLDDIRTMGFRGEALASMAAVSRFELVTRREKDDAGTRLRIEGGILKGVEACSAPVGTRVSVNRLYFNTPARAKFLKGMATELSQCIDAVQRHALAHDAVGFQIHHNEKRLLDIPEHATLRERVALIWGLAFLKDMVDFDVEVSPFRFRGLIGGPGLTRSARTHQYFFFNRRPVVSRSLLFGFEEGYRGLVTVGRHPVGIVLVEAHPRLADINVHPAKREIRFRDEPGVRAAIREAVRKRMDDLRPVRSAPTAMPQRPAPFQPDPAYGREERPAPPDSLRGAEAAEPEAPREPERGNGHGTPVPDAAPPFFDEPAPQQTEFEPEDREAWGAVEPGAVYDPVGVMGDAPMQLFDTYLLVPEDDRLLIIDQHALHERMTYDVLVRELDDREYESQQLAVPLLIDIPPSHGRLLETNLDLFRKLGIEIEPFGGNTYQVTAIYHLYEEGKVSEMVGRILDTLAQGDLFDKADFMPDLFRLATEACRASVRGGDRLSPEERRSLLNGFRRLRPPYTCPHGRPIITELTQVQMEKSFRRRQ